MMNLTQKQYNYIIFFLIEGVIVLIITFVMIMGCFVNIINNNDVCDTLFYIAFTVCILSFISLFFILVMYHLYIKLKKCHICNNKFKNESLIICKICKNKICYICLDIKNINKIDEYRKILYCGDICKKKLNVNYINNITRKLQLHNHHNDLNNIVIDYI